MHLEDDAREGEDEEDWLPPPPPQIIDAALDLAEDETIQKLRCVVIFLPKNENPISPLLV